MKESQNKNPGMRNKGSHGQNFNAGQGRRAGPENYAGKQGRRSNRQPPAAEDDTE